VVTPVQQRDEHDCSRTVLLGFLRTGTPWTLARHSKPMWPPLFQISGP